MSLPAREVAAEERRIWEANRVTQFGVTHNVLLGLATAAVGFIMNADEANRLALGLSGASLIAGLALTWTRLLDFRLTARRYRLAEGENRGASVEWEFAKLQSQADALGRVSWRLLALQTATFLLAGIALAWPIFH